MKRKFIRQMFNVLLLILSIGYIIFLNIDIVSGMKIGLVCIITAFIRFYALGDKCDDGMD